MVDENIRKAAEMANAIRNRSDFELLVTPETNVLLYRYDRRRGGRLWCKAGSRVPPT
jgi:glutamate/tyrosine decarboxylase-like PLP-dependent enzyme